MLLNLLFRHSVVRVVGLSKLCEFPQRGPCAISVWTTTQLLSRIQVLSSETKRSFLGKFAAELILASPIAEKPSTEHGSRQKRTKCIFMVSDIFQDSNIFVWLQQGRETCKFV